jgi:hypothetical protein
MGSTACHIWSGDWLRHSLRKTVALATRRLLLLYLSAVNVSQQGRTQRRGRSLCDSRYSENNVRGWVLLLRFCVMILRGLWQIGAVSNGFVALARQNPGCGCRTSRAVQMKLLIDWEKRWTRYQAGARQHACQCPVKTCSMLLVKS